MTNRQEVEKYGGELIRYAQSGDSLHGIAFVYGLKVKRLAAWNGLQEVDRLSEGQRIRLTAPIGFRMPKIEAKPLQKPLSKPEVATSSEKKPVNEKTVDTKRSNQGSNDSPAARAVTTWDRKQSWLWPLRGSLSQRYEPARGKQGINIQSQVGQAIKASRAGKVVYSGSSLKGYGHLIIIKHDESYLSAYAYTQNVNVKEGDIVQSAQRIASVGRDNLGVAALHFQIRKDGDPINPLTKLPKS